jgi:ATP-dependent DNA helicase RecQ
VHYAYAKEKAMLKLAIAAEKPMLVFCGTRNRAEQSARLLLEYFGRDTVRFYHAGLSREEKKLTETWFFPKKDAILCATCAFGMGVDKSDIRTVIHLDPPSTAEAYIQEAGRGGRDGKVSNAILLWSPADHKKALALPEGDRGRVLMDLCERGTCRRQILLDALGGEQTPCSGCDVCEGTARSGAEDGAEALRFFRQNGMRYTIFESANRLMAEANRRDAPKLGLRIWEHQDYQAIIDALLAEKKLVRGKWLWKERVVKVVS